MRNPLLLAAGLLLLAGCNNKEKPPDKLPGNGSVKDLTPASTGSELTFQAPVDAALSPDGKMAYFIAVGSSEAALYRTPAPSTAAPTLMHQGAPLAAPFGIDVTADGKTVVVADPGAQLDEESLERGELFAVSSEGGSPAPIKGATGLQPRGVIVTTESNIEMAYFTGREKTTETAGIFKVPVAGGEATLVGKSADLVEPSGLTIARDGTVYFMDSGDPQKSSARLMKLSGGTITTQMADIHVGYPAGIALSQDEKTLLISAKDPQTGTDAVLRVPVAGGEAQTITDGISEFEEPAGIHRARNVDTFVWADSKANGSGTVYVINKQQ